MNKNLIIMFLILALAGGYFIFYKKAGKLTRECGSGNIHSCYKAAQKAIDQHKYAKAAYIYRLGCEYTLPETQICRLKTRLEELDEKKTSCQAGSTRVCKEAAMTFLYWERDLGYEILDKHQDEIYAMLTKGCAEGDKDACVLLNSGLLLKGNRQGYYQTPHEYKD